MYKKILIILSLITTGLYLNAKSPSLDDYALLPTPQSIEFGKSVFNTKMAKLEIPVWKNEWINQLNKAGVKIDEKSRFTITGSLVKSLPMAPTENDEAYELNITKNGIEVKALSEKGIYWALMTLEQLIAKDKNNKITLPECHIIDWPAFSIRGFLMDVGRTYISMEELKREIEIMSKFKLNVFHWHLTENQAWRLESKIFPMINDSINTVRQPGKYYTVEEAKELTCWAAQHNMILIPEIDMPGHSEAFRRTFRHDMQSSEGMKILKLLLEEAVETFDSVPYFHIGTDEVAFTNPNFVPEMVNFMRDKGKKVISWNPGWKYQPGEIDMIQMWSYRGKPLANTPSIDSRFHYINHFDTYADIVALYRSNIYGETKENNDIVGSIIALWNDRNVDNEDLNIAQNSVYTLMLAFAERTWDGGGSEYFDKLGTNMGDPESADFKQFADFERRLLLHKTSTLKDIYIPYVKQTNVHWRISDAFPNEGNLSTVFPPETEGPKLSYIYNDSIYNTRETTGAGIYLRHVWGNTIPAFYENPQANHTAYAFTKVFSPKDQTVGLQVETQNYSRSESDVPPMNGKWDYRESRIWINGQEIFPPDWTASHTTRDNEIPLGNENFSAREPMLVKLHKGWNDVMLKLPVGYFQTYETRLVKWMFTFVFTTPDGREAVPGLIYSSEIISNSAPDA